MKRALAALLSLSLALAIPSKSFAILAEVKTGPVVSGDGAVNSARSDKSGALVNTEAHGRYQEAAYRGKLFTLPSGSTTVVANNASAGNLGTIQFIDGFYNPIGSGVDAVILDAKETTVSGTPGGPFLWNYYCGLNITSAATGTIRAGVLSNSAANSAMIPQVQVAVTATPSATPAAILYGIVGGPDSAPGESGVQGTFEDVAGKIIVPPGCVFGMASTATGTSHVVQASITYEEIPL